MNFETARAAIFNRLDAYCDVAHVGVAVRYENRLLVDLATRVDPFIACEIVYSGGLQASLGTDPLARYSGGIWLSVWQKEDTGTTTSATWLGGLAAHFKAKQFGGVNTQVPIPIPTREHAGWRVATIRVPFWFDDL
jgi:hypothetical protein